VHIAICKATLRLPENESLKGKRQVTRSLIARVHNKFNVSVAEVEDNHLWQRLTLGISCVSNSPRHANEVISQVVEYINTIRGDLELLDYEVEVFPGP